MSECACTHDGNVLSGACGLHAEWLRDTVKRELAATQSALARYENAVMPEEPDLYDSDGYICEGGVKPKFVLIIDYGALRIYAAAQTVRADENERDARRYRWLRKNATPGLFNPAFAARSLSAWKTGPEIDAAIDALKDAP